MKATTSILTALTFAACAIMPSAAEEKDHDHEGHDHAHIVAGPNGGRVIMDVEPHLEFLVNADRSVTITALDEDNKAATIGKQTVSVIAGKRTSPTRLKFEAKGGVLVSDGKLPAGNDFPVVVQIKPKKLAKKVMAKFNLNLNDCPTCDYKEYACACCHGDDHEGHDHAEPKKK